MAQTSGTTHGSAAAAIGKQRRSLRHGDLRRGRRSDRPQADSRALQPGARSDLLSREFAVVGVARTPHDRTTTSARKFTTTSRHCRGERVDHDLWEWFLAPLLLLHRRFQRRQPVSAAERLARTRSIRTTRPTRISSTTSRPRPTSSARSSSKLSAAGLMEEDNGHWRRVIIEKPFGHDLESAKALNQQLLQGGRRKADLPHRSLPGQRNRPEHYGVPLRQRNLRADLEPPLHRPRADLGGRNRRRRGARQLLRSRRARCATWCRTTSCNSSASPRWSRRFPSTPMRCATSRPRFCTPSSP